MPLVCIRTLESRGEEAVLRSKLEAYGIASFLLPPVASGRSGALGFTPGTRLMVAQEDAADAREIVGPEGTG